MAVSIPAPDAPKQLSSSDLRYCGPDEKDDLRDSPHEVSSIYSQDVEPETEEELDKRLQLEAAELGINIAQITPLTSVQESAETVARIEPVPLALEQSVSSRFSQSTLPISCSSSEQQPVTNFSSFSTFSVPSGAQSITSLSSKRSSYLKFKSGFRRISGFRKRKLAIGHPIPILPSVTPKARMDVQSEPDVLATIVSLQRVSISPGHGGLKDATLVRQPCAFTVPIYEHGATRRSLDSKQLRALRAKHLEEQRKITKVQQERQRVSQATHESRKVDMISHYQQLEQSMRDRHHQAMMTMEDRHLSAEVDLHGTLGLQRQACETRLRHMEAYCNSPMLIEGMPIRMVTDKDFRGLAQQYHVRDSMESLHVSRINVLREKQAKQMANLVARQEEELAKLNEQCQSELAGLDLLFNQRAAQDRLLFEARERRLARIWTLEEAIARRRLEIESGEQYAPLAPITFGG